MFAQKLLCSEPSLAGWREIAAKTCFYRSGASPTKRTSKASRLTMTISTTGSIAANNYSPAMAATSGSLQHTATEALTVGNRADFSVDVPSQTVNVALSSSNQSSINVTPGQGIVDYTVSLQVSAPAGVNASFSSTTVTPPAFSTLTLSAAATASTGPSTIAITTTRNVDNKTVTSAFPIYIDPRPGTIPGNRTNRVRVGRNPIAAYYDAPRTRWNTHTAGP